MSSDLPLIPVRLPRETIEKFKIVAADNNRSMSKEAAFLIRSRIKKYELENGEIIIEQKST